MAVIDAIAKQNAEERIIRSLDEMGRKAQNLKELGLRVVLTSGSFDLIHLGHAKYVQRAKECGDILVVGVDSDEKIRLRKGDDRPMVPEDERMQMLAHQRPVDYIYLKAVEDPRWALIKAVSPDVLVLTEDHSYDEREQEALLEYCGHIEVLKRQATVTTSGRIGRITSELIRQAHLHMGERGPELAEGLVPELLVATRAVLASDGQEPDTETGAKLAAALRETIVENLPGLIESLPTRE